MILQYIKDLFPRIIYDESADIIGPESLNFNCIMYAIGGQRYNIWPSYFRPIGYNTDKREVFWPTDLPNSESLNNFIAMFRKFKYELCDDSSYEPDFRKIAIFCYFGTNQVSHASLMIGEDLWASKIGKGHIIQHKLESLCGEVYGELRCFMKRLKTIPRSFNQSVFDMYVK